MLVDCSPARTGQSSRTATGGLAWGPWKNPPVAVQCWSCLFRPAPFLQPSLLTPAAGLWVPFHRNRLESDVGALQFF